MGARNDAWAPTSARLALAHVPTPLYRVERISAATAQGDESPNWLDERGVEVWVKRDDMTGGVEAGNKIRKLEFLLADAAARGADTLVTCGGIQSNHARATAALGARLGLRTHLLLRTTDPELEAILAEVAAYPNVARLPAPRDPEWDEPQLLIPVRLDVGGNELSMFTTLTTFGTPRDVTLDELAVELFFPADEPSEQLLRGAASSAGG